MKPIVVRNLRIGEGIPKICVPIIGQTKEEIMCAAEDVLEVPADLVEWRADWFQDVFEIEHVKDVLAELRAVLKEIPLLFTFRTKEEGGERPISEREYARLNQAVIASGKVDLVDVEVFTAENVVQEVISCAHRYGIKVIGSNHDFAKTPDKKELIRRLCHMQEVGVDIPKLAVMPQGKEDVLNLLCATAEMESSYADRPIITMSMAGLGTVSRMAGEVFGSAVTFGAVKKASAPGQIEVNELKHILEVMHGAL